MKKITILSFLFAITLFNSCKKVTTPPEEEIPTTPVASHPDGYLKNYLACNIISNTLPLKKTYSASANFYADSTVNDLVEVDSVTLNKVTLKMRTNKTYYRLDSTIAGAESNWHVQGKNAIGTFDHKFLLPSYGSYNLLPDSINLHQDLVIPVTTILNCTKGSITLFDNLGKSISKEFKPGYTNITFSAAELAFMHKYVKFYLFINLFNQETQKFNGERFYFENQLSIDKYLIPY